MLKPTVFPEVTDLIPHRPPFLFVDRLVAVDGEISARGERVVQSADCLSWTRSGRPAMPAVLVLEAGAQLAGAFLAFSAQCEGAVSAPGPHGMLAFIRRVTVSGLPVFKDKLKLSVTEVKQFQNLVMFATRVEDQHGTGLLEGEFAVSLPLGASRRR